jgi:uncharacterized protein YyaL (SSP411 family)
MAFGGIYDQAGGGFARYSTDALWKVPHFEKMLYDNALLSRLFLHTYLVIREPFYKRIVTQTLDYVVREMTASSGGFYSTQDADSEGEEGKFFVWTPAEVEQLLGSADARLFNLYYDVTVRGSFEGHNILHVDKKAQAIADSGAGVSLDELKQALARGRSKLFAAREQRIKPNRDEKVLTAWNGMMLTSFAEAARYLKRSDYLQIAQNNARFLLQELMPDGRLLRTWKDGRAHLKAYLEDYACLAEGLLALYEADFDPTWFKAAQNLMQQAIELFADDENGGFFDTGTDHDQLINRPKDIMDNATPAGNNVAASVLLRLAALTGDEAYRQRADDYLRPLSEVMLRHPQSFGYALIALEFALAPVREIAIVGASHEPATQTLLDTANATYRPNSVLASAAPDDTAAIQTIPLLADRLLKDGQPAAYVCQHFACQAPVNTGEELAKLLG